MARKVTARMAGLRPGTSPPPVRMAMTPFLRRMWGAAIFWSWVTSMSLLYPGWPGRRDWSVPCIGWCREVECDAPLASLERAPAGLVTVGHPNRGHEDRGDRRAVPRQSAAVAGAIHHGAAAGAGR